MEIPQTYLDKFQPAAQAPRNERDEGIARFLGHGIKLTKKGKLEDATARDLAIQLSHVKTDDLYYLYVCCRDARSFSRMFWFKIRPKRV